MQSTNQPAAGWYTDPYDPQRQRLWNGWEWTSQTQPMTQPAAPADAARTPWWHSWTVVVSALIVFFPIGLLLLWQRRSTGLGAKIMLTGLVAAVFVSAGALGSSADPGGAPVGPPERAASVTSAPAATTTTTSPAPKAAPAPAPTPTPTPTPTPRATPATAPRVSTPVLAGLSVAQAKARLAGVRLVLGSIRKQPSAAAAGTVLAQSLSAGTGLAPGTTVNLVVASPYPTVSSVAGRSRTSATQALRSGGFAVRVTLKTVTSGTNGRVLSQSPPGGTKARPGSTVTIVVARVVAPAPPSTPKPSTSNCTPGYSPCLPPASDYDCAGGSGNGPEYAVGPIRVTGDDPYDLDRDGDGYGCED